MIFRIILPVFTAPVFCVLHTRRQEINVIASSTFVSIDPQSGETIIGQDVGRNKNDQI